ncbi:MAG: hypothetical protein ACRD22_05170 [Terriglobia bacterium]
MSLIHRKPFLTEKELAARRANARQSTGPRTARGKARVALNGIKHGGYVVNLREKLARMGDREALAVYDRFELACALRVGSEADRREVARMAARVWCAGRVLKRMKADRGNVLESIKNEPRIKALLRIRVQDPWQRLGVSFWRQRRRYALVKLWREEFIGCHLHETYPPRRREPAAGLEDHWRVRQYRTRRLSLWETERLKRLAERAARAR